MDMALGREQRGFKGTYARYDLGIVIDCVTLTFKSFAYRRNIFRVSNRVRNFRGRVSYFNQSEARKGCFLASDWSKYETLPRKFRTL